MSKKKRSRTYLRLTKADRRSIEEGLERRRSIRDIAKAIGKSPSTVHDEVMRHRFVTSPKSRFGESAPGGLEEVCARLGSWPRCCNGCRRRAGYGCHIRPKVFYRASLAQKAADRTLSQSRAGVDETEEEFRKKVATIKGCLLRGLSPEQIVHIHPELGISKSTIYGWIDRGYAGMSNMDLRRKVSYRPRHHQAPRRSTKHSGRRSHDEFLRLPSDVRDSAWEMDTVEGGRQDVRCLLTLYHRPTSFQLALPIKDRSVPAVLHGLGLLQEALGSAEAMRRVFSLVLTDNGSEFSDEEALAGALGERDGETRLFYCDPRRADQKGGCERNHSEIRKLLPKGKGIKFDLLTRQDAALLMSEVNSEPRGKLAWLSPRDMFLRAFGGDAQRLLDALGIERIAAEDLDLTLSRLEKARLGRGEAPLI